MRPTLTTWLVCAALGISLAGNAYFVVRLRAAGSPLPERSPLAAQAPLCEPALAAASKPGPTLQHDTCEEELSHCLQSGWNLVLREITRQPLSAGKETKQPADGNRITLARKREALCDISKTYLHDHWLANKDTITRFLTTDLTDPRRQTKETRETVEEMSRALGLTADETDVLTADYGRLRDVRIAHIRDALGQSPADYETFLLEAKGLFADEDALLERVEGGDAKERWRAQSLTDRTSRLAILATFAGSSWDAATEW
jgi:hypothetical protein